MNLQEYQKALLEVMAKAEEDFNGKIPALQRKALGNVLEIIKEIELKDGRIRNTSANLKRISRLRSAMEKGIFGPELNKAMTTFLAAFDQITAIQEKYFKAMDMRPPEDILKELKAQAKAAVLRQLTAEIDTRIIPGVEEILRIYTTQGASYAQLTSILTEYIVGTGEIEGSFGKLANQARTITVDSLNTFNAQYNEITSAQYNLRWRMYVGSLLKTSRDWCKAMVDKKYVHVKEIPGTLKGQVGEKKIKINPKTGLWYGAKETTNAQNIQILRGGYQCGHQFLSVPEAVVPLQVRIQVYNKYGIRHENGKEIL